MALIVADWRRHDAIRSLGSERREMLSPDRLAAAGEHFTLCPVAARSVMPALMDQPSDRRYHVSCELADSRIQAMARSHLHELVQFQGHRCRQLFDLEKDPDETRNLRGVSGYADINSGHHSVPVNWRLVSTLRTRKVTLRTRKVRRRAFNAAGVEHAAA